MFTLTLLRFSPLPKESHLIALAMGFLTYIMDSSLNPSADLISSFTTAIVIGCCWYVYKVFDGITYDGSETVFGPLLGLGMVVVVAACYFLI